MSHHVATPARLEAFSDGVIAVIITIMVLELKVPHQDGLAGLRAVLPTLCLYFISFAFTGIYWKAAVCSPSIVLAGVLTGVQTKLDTSSGNLFFGNDPLATLRVAPRKAAHLFFAW